MEDPTQYQREIPSKEKGLSPSKILWNGALGISVILLGLWIGKSITAENLINPPVLLALGLAGVYLTPAFAHALLYGDFPLSLQWLVPITTFYLCIQGIFPNIERSLYWGELIAFSWLPALLRADYRHPIQKWIILMVYFVMFVVPVYGTLYTLLYWSEDYRVYFGLRHLAMFHYIVFFFAAYRYPGRFLDVMARFFWVPVLMVLVFIPDAISRTLVQLHPALAVGPIGFTVVLAGSYLAFLHRGFQVRLRGIGFAVLIVAIFLSSHRSTNMVIIGVLVALFPALWGDKMLRLFIPQAVRKLVCIITVSGLVVGSAWGLWVIGAELQENVIYKINIVDMPATAGIVLNENVEQSRAFRSAMWRAAMWAHFIHLFVNHPLGIGVGTPVFQTDLRNIMSLGKTEGKSWEYQSYTTGAHNSFITLVARFGVLFLIPLTVWWISFWRGFREYLVMCRYNPLKSGESALVFGTVILLGVVIVEAMFNVFVETPLYAGLYWFAVGLATRLLGDFLAGQSRRNKYGNIPVVAPVV